MIKQIDAYININNTKVLSQELTTSPLLNNSMIGLNEKSLDLIYDLYDLWEIKKNRLPQHSGENKKITKTLSGIIAIFNALRSGTFASDFELDQKWMTDNKIDTSAIERSYANWPDFYKLIFTSASQYIKSTNKAKRVGILAFLYTQYGVGGTQCPPYSLFLKYTSKKPMRESKVQISKIKGRYSEKLANTIEKFYNSMLGKFEQIFSDRERLRFWRGITKLDGWLAENSSICELRNTDGSFGTHFGNIGLFLSTLFNWLENEGGAWNKLWPDVIIIDSEQWKKFENYCKAKLNVDLDLGSESRRVQLERVYKMERERRESYWEAHREDIIQEEAIRIEERSEKAQHPLEWKYCLSNSEEEVDAQRFKDDLEWSEAWDARLIAAK